MIQESILDVIRHIVESNVVGGRDTALKGLALEYPISFVNKVRKFPEIPKGRYVGTLSAHNCHTNAKKSTKLKYELYVGYLIFYDDYEGWIARYHAFNVKDGKVIEMTKLDPSIKWSNVVYVGKLVPKKDYSYKKFADPDYL